MHVKNWKAMLIAGSSLCKWFAMSCKGTCGGCEAVARADKGGCYTDCEIDPVG